MTSPSILLIVTSLTFLGLNMGPEEAPSSRHSNVHPALMTVSRPRPAVTQQGSEPPKQITVTGVVIALNSGIVLTDGPCRQSMVVRVIRRDKGRPKNSYVLVRRDYGCDAKPLPIEMFQAKRRWGFTLIRDLSCDHTYEEIDDIVGISPGGGYYRIPIMKIVSGNEGDRMSTTQKFACYRLKGVSALTRSSSVNSNRPS